jgi:hypothetical protein
MKCKTCEGEVPPKFSHAILTNICPLCGEEIMDVELQSALKDLKSAMAAATNYPAEIFDWLKSNYRLHSDEDLAQAVTEASSKAEEMVRSTFTGQKHQSRPVDKKTVEEQLQEVKLDENGNQISGPALQSSDQTRKFFKNALVTRTLDNQSHFKNIVKQIKKSGGTSVPDESGGSNVFTPDMAEMMDGDDGGGGSGQVDPAELAQLKAAFGDTSDYTSGGSSDDIDDPIPSIVLNMADRAANNGGSGQRDLVKLQALQNKSAKAKSEMARSGSVGLIRR